MVVAIRQPCRVRYRRRVAATVAVPAIQAKSAAAAAPTPYRVCVDLDLCQGHAVCVNEAPEVFTVERNEDDEDKVVLRSTSPSPELREKVANAVRHCPTRALSLEE